jgi:hypothetical protein
VNSSSRTSVPVGHIFATFVLLVSQATLISSCLGDLLYKKHNRNLHNYCQGNPKPLSCGLRIIDAQLSFTESHAFSVTFVGCLWSIKVCNEDHTVVGVLWPCEGVADQGFRFRFLFRRYEVLISVDAYCFSPSSLFPTLIFLLEAVSCQMALFPYLQNPS